MNKKTIVKIVLGGVIVLFLFIGFYSFSELTVKEKGSETDLYSLIPTSSTAVLQVDNLNNLILDLGKLNFRQHYAAFRLSDFLSFMKDNVDLINASKAHGLSSQMNKMLLSFHPPYTTKDQILYCRLGSGDQDLIEKIIRENGCTLFNPKTFLYKNEEIRIYPLENNEFLACYFKPGFFVASFQKKLIEEVIDAMLSRQSLLSDTIFSALYTSKKNQNPLTLYIKTDQIPLGKADDYSFTAKLAGWTELDVKLNRNAIYFTGRCLDDENGSSFEKVLKAQLPVESASGKDLPYFTHFFYQMASSNLPDLFTYSPVNKLTMVPTTNLVHRNDSILTQYLTDIIGEEINYLMFHDNDSSAVIRKLLHFQLKENRSPEAEKPLGTLYKKNYLNGKSYPVFKLPSNTLFAQFTGKPRYQGDIYGCIYQQNLLIAPNDSSIYSYIRQMETKQVIEKDMVYKECLSSIAPESNYLLMCDLEEAFLHADSYEQLIPHFFFAHKEFFRYFILTCQFTHTNGKIYPYLSLTYKG